MSDPAALVTSPGDVVDAHVHVFAMRLLREFAESQPEASARLMEALEDGGSRWKGREIPDLEPGAAAAGYAERLDRAGVAKAVVMSVFPDSEFMREFLAAAAGRIHALANVDPTSPGAPAALEREMAVGFRGCKLLPVNRKYRLSSPECRPFFEKAAELGAAVTVHYGVTVDPHGDLRYADPLDLSPVARDFPEVTFVVAHFGAGFLDQVLKIGYQCPNVCVDSSGTNNWMDYMPYEMTLADAFARSISALGAERVLFGTDSNNVDRYRDWIKSQQLGTLDELGLSERQRDLVLRANAVRVFRMDE